MADLSNSKGQKQERAASSNSSFSEASLSLPSEVVRSSPEQTTVDQNLQMEMWKRIEAGMEQGLSKYELATIAGSYGNKELRAAYMEDHQRDMEVVWKAIEKAQEHGASDAAVARIAKAMGAQGIADVILGTGSNTQPESTAPAADVSKPKVSELDPRKIKAQLEALLQQVGHLPDVQTDTHEAMKFIDLLYGRAIQGAYALTGQDRVTAQALAKESYVSGLTELADELQKQIKKHPVSVTRSESDPLFKNAAVTRQQINELAPGTVNHLGTLRNSLKF